MISNENGKFELKLKPDSEYKLYCTKLGCFSRTDKISTKGLKYSQDFYADFLVEPIVINKPIVLENIYYDFDKWNIRDDAAKELDKLVKILKDNPQIDIEMGSHTDVRGNDQYNQILSDKRAKAAVDYLISQGIDTNRLTYKGYGEKVLVNGCVNDVFCTEEDHQKNRRTEFKVTEIHEQ
jgi:outer membrane protein OmpA-like peptidoglycan-associated protein